MSADERDIKRAQAECLKRMNDQYTVIRDGGKTRVVSEEFDPALGRPYLIYSEFADIAKFHHKLIQVDEMTWVSEGEWWLKHQDRSQCKGLVFAPGQGDYVEGYRNTWRGFAVEPVKGNWDLLQEHLFENICRSISTLFLYVMAWMAAAVQRPSERPDVAVVLHSLDRGTGKGIFVRYFLSLFGRHGAQVASARQVLGNFNAHLADLIVLFLDEALWAGDKAAEGVLKMLITEPIIPIERKYCDVQFVKNRLRILMASNNEWAVPCGIDERRFLVLDVDPKHKQDHEYFGRIVEQMENGGCAAMLYDLLHYDYSGIDLRQAPKTGALLAQKLLSMDPRDRWWYGKLASGNLLSSDEGWLPEVSKSRLHEDYVQELRLTGVMRARTETELGMWLRKMLGSGLAMTRPMMAGRRTKCWAFPSLRECRDLFDRMTDSEHDWPEPEPTGERLPYSLMPGQPR